MDQSTEEKLQTSPYSEKLKVDTTCVGWLGGSEELLSRTWIRIILVLKIATHIIALQIT